mgnify:CR=1 FL=1
MLPFSALTFLLIIGLSALHRFLTKKTQQRAELQFRKQLIFSASVILALIILLIALPIKDSLRGQLFSLLGIMVSAIIALSSTTIVGNIMAGLMLRSIHSFNIGDFIKIDSLFGRVSEIDLLHVEIQTEDRDLQTLPNLFLINQPFTVIHSTGTVISSEVSLGYDIGRKKLEKLLLEAAETAELKDPFVQIMALGDFSISYRVGGMLTEVKHVISSRSKLRSAILDVLHRHEIEIASPTLMNQRQFPKETRFIPPASNIVESDSEKPANIEAIVFDKAERATKVDRLRKRLEQNERLLAELEKELGSKKDDELNDLKKRKLSLLRHQNKRLKNYLIDVEKKKESREKNESSDAENKDS